MVIDEIKNGIVLDHITAGRSMVLYNMLNLDSLDSSVAIIKNVSSGKMGKKDIIKVDEVTSLNFDVLGYIDPGITVNIVRNGKRTEKFKPVLPERLESVIECKNPRCITSTEQELPHVFKLTDREKRVYRCIYCESKAKKQKWEE
ncbi:MAG: aspartate carbamoyltransferase regulatory subunit [Clostridia bacterium]|nr:aspartate carbamoyltransferase regulatory subunit [Clostridia bacterium]